VNSLSGPMPSPPSPGGPVPVLSFNRGTLTLTGLATPPGPPFVRDGRTGQWRCEAMHYRAVKARLAGRARDTLLVPELIRWPRLAVPELRGDQFAALDAWEHAGRRGQIIMPPGTGKTVVALAAMARCGVATLVVASIRDLMYQWHRRIEAALGVKAGILGDGRREIWPVTVTTYDSASIHMERMGDRFGLVIFDEEHHLPARGLCQAAEMCAGSWRMGLTARPERADGRHVLLDSLIGPIVYRQAVAQARRHTPAEYQVVRIPVALSDDEQRRYDDLSHRVREFMLARSVTRAGQEQGSAVRRRPYTWKDLCRDAARDSRARRALRAYQAKVAIETRAAEKLRVLEDLFKLHSGEQVLIFTGSSRMALAVSQRFLIPMIIDKTGKQERKAVLDGFREGRFRALVTTQTLDEGIDVPAVTVGVIIGGFGSPRQAQQRLGRILRGDGNLTAVLYEVVCQETREATCSHARRRGEAFKGARRMER
jgi:superfamily II DNA or RNA helicase